MRLSRASRRRENFPAPRLDNFLLKTQGFLPKTSINKTPSSARKDCRHYMKSCRILSRRISSRDSFVAVVVPIQPRFLPCRQVHNRPIQKPLRLFRGRIYTIKSRGRLCHPAAFKAGGIQRPTEAYSAKTLVNNHSGRSAIAFEMLIEVRGIKS